MTPNELKTMIASTVARTGSKKQLVARAALLEAIDAEVDRLYAAAAVAEKVYPAATVEAYLKVTQKVVDRAQAMLIEALARGAGNTQETAALLCEYRRTAGAMNDYAKSRSLSWLTSLAVIAGIAPLLFASYAAKDKTP